MSALTQGLSWTLVIAMGAMGGLYYAFSAFIMRSLAVLPGTAGPAAMRSINELIVRSTFMPFFVLTSLSAAGMALYGVIRWSGPSSGLMVAAGLVYLVGMFGVTAAGNVPLNDALASASSTELMSVWAGYLKPWVRYNSLRAVACLLASALLAASSILDSGN